MDHDLKLDAGIFQEIIDLFIPLHLQGLVLVPCLIIVSVFPKDPNANEVLAQFIGTSQVRSGEKSQSATVYLQRLVNGKFHGEICCLFFVLRIYCVG